jgi:DinB family protein
MDAPLARIDAVEERLTALASRPVPGGRTEPDPGGSERWEAAQVWAHIGEFGDYWLDELDALMASEIDAPPFGRVKSNPVRIAAIEQGRHAPASEHLAAARAAIDRLRAFVRRLDDAGWARTATHRSLGALSMERILEEFLIGHYEQHAAQLETLA